MCQQPWGPPGVQASPPPPPKTPLRGRRQIHKCFCSLVVTSGNRPNHRGILDLLPTRDAPASRPVPPPRACLPAAPAMQARWSSTPTPRPRVQHLERRRQKEDMCRIVRKQEALEYGLEG
jgi:hypothetical protein